MLKKLLGIVVLCLLLNGCGGPQDAGAVFLIYIVAIICVFAVGVLISPIWEVPEKKSTKKIYDRQNPSHTQMFQPYPKYKDRYLEVVVQDRQNKSDRLFPHGTIRYKPRYIEIPTTSKERDKFWKMFYKKYRK